jgi:NADPH:quinone reductase-like Zn-dependent oxidoreductase
MRCVEEQQLKPVIAQHFAMENTAEAIATLTDNAPLGKIVIDID